MAGINVPQYDILKINTKKLKYYKWNLDINIDDAYKCEEVVALFQSELFRLIALILDKDIKEIDFMKYILLVVINTKSDFWRVTNNKGVIVNNIQYKRFVGTAGGLKNNTLIFINASIIDKLNELCNCGRKQNVPIVPAKLETYKALTCSASQPICDPKGILVVSDCMVNIKDDIIKIDDSGDNIEPQLSFLKDQELINNISDGFNLCTPEYMERVSQSLGLDYVTDGVCLRNAWLKGMLYPFPIVEFVEKYNGGSYLVADIWGQEHDIRDIEMILTESTLKLWSFYDSIDDYVNAYHSHGYSFAVTKICPHELEHQREVNYQYLQSYDFTDEDIRELCAPTVKYLKDSLCGDYSSTLKFLGINQSVEHNTWQQALYVNEYMLGDPFIIDSVYKMIRKKIDMAKIGKILVDGNYQVLSGDPFALMQHVCGIKATGLLNANEAYSRYWNDCGFVSEVVVFRSPMTAHNNIRKCHLVDNSDTEYWYKYNKTTFIINGFDTFCQAENGADKDGDTVFSTNNPILLKRHKTLPAIICIQRNAEKIIPTEKDILNTNINGMGNKVGSVTNKITGMMEVQSHFDPNSEEYKKLEYRILCGQLFQQNEIDKIKGIVAKPMPKYWYDYHACDGDRFLQSICMDKKPYFMIYVYRDYHREYKIYTEEADKTALLQFNKTITELLASNTLSEDEAEFVRYYKAKHPFGMGNCSLNRICWYIENEFDGIVAVRKHNANFDYEFIKTKRRCTNQHRSELLELQETYKKWVDREGRNAKHNSTDAFYDRFQKKELRIKYFRRKAEQICPNDEERLNILLDMHYQGNGSGQFCWECVGHLIIARLEELNDSNQ